MRRVVQFLVLGSMIAGCKTADPSGPIPPDNQSPANLAVTAGDGQTAAAGSAVPVAPAVRVTDAGGSPVAGVSVSFSVTAGGGGVSGSPAVTGTDGVATVGGWTLGGIPGLNELTAQVGALQPITFTATAIGGFDVQLQYLTGATTAQRQAFDNAAGRWESLVIGDLPDALLNAQAGQCGSNSPAVNETIDDLLILVTVESIDGPGGVLGSAGPCFVRLPSNLPILGQMRFDTDDLDVLQATGLLELVILHEMGHVLGVGTLWQSQGLLVDPSLSGGADPHFSGPQAIAAFDNVGGSSYAGGKVPVEDTGGTGTADGHWRESVLDTELMTGFLDAGQPNELSIVTVESLEDQGYTTNSNGADTFTLGALAVASAASGTEIALLNDIWRGPIYGIDASGQVIRVVRP